MYQSTTANSTLPENENLSLHNGTQQLQLDNNQANLKPEPKQLVQYNNVQGQENNEQLPAVNNYCNYSLSAAIDQALPASLQDIGPLITSADFENVQYIQEAHNNAQETGGDVHHQRLSPLENEAHDRQYQQVVPAQFINLDCNNQYDTPIPHPPLFAETSPFVEVIEQPAKCSLRFRYKCEGRSAGSLAGVNSTVDNKTYPAIKILNYVGKAVVVVSCVTKDAPYQAHPHNIVGKEGCKKGICTVKVNCSKSNTVKTFSSLGIQCVKRKDIEESLSLRESINVDPFRNGFAHKYNGSSIDLNVVRLCFQVFVEGSTPNKYDVPLSPIVSEPVHDKKAMTDLAIIRLSHCSAPATGGREVILLCNKIAKDDVQIRFYEERNDKLVWETYTEFSPNDVHKQAAICFRTPKYRDENITQPVMARIQLKRVSDNQESEPRLFQFLPCESDEDMIMRKRQKIEWVNMNQLIHQPQAHNQPTHANSEQQQAHPLHHHHHQQQQQQQHHHLQQRQHQLPHHQNHQQQAPQQLQYQQRQILQVQRCPQPNPHQANLDPQPPQLGSHQP